MDYSCAVHFPQGERHDRLSGHLKPPWKVAPLSRGVLQLGKVLAGWGAEDPLCRTCSRARAPGPLGEFNWDGLFTVRSDHLLSGTRFAPETVLEVCGESVGTPSDPS